MIYVWLGAFIPCIVFPFFRELAYSLWLLCSALHSPDVSIRPSLPMLLKLDVRWNFIWWSFILEKNPAYALLFCYVIVKNPYFII